MGVWDSYKSRMELYGETKREITLNNTQSHLSRKIRDTLSCHDVLINGVRQTITILNQKTKPDVKRICALPGEKLAHGGIVDFANGKWLITEVDSNDEVYAVGEMQRCNYLLKWINQCGKIIEKWCIVEDGTKYLIGEKTKEVITIGDARIAVTVGKDPDTNMLKRGMRFLIDDMDSDDVLAYQITKPNKLFNVYNGEGIFRFILNEVNLTDNDNVELRIADYANWKPHTPLESDHVDSDKTIEEVVKDAFTNSDDYTDKGVWI